MFLVFRPQKSYAESGQNVKSTWQTFDFVHGMEECAHAVCDFRGLEYYSFLFSGDLLDSKEWDKRILGDDEETKHQLSNFYIALELALRI